MCVIKEVNLQELTEERKSDHARDDWGPGEVESVKQNRQRRERQKFPDKILGSVHWRSARQKAKARPPSAGHMS